MCGTFEKTSSLSLVAGYTATFIIEQTSSDFTATRSGEAVINTTADGTAEESLLASSSSSFENQDYVLTEHVRLVFEGNVATAEFLDTVYGLTETFLTRATRDLKAEDGSDWSYELSSTLQPINFENVTTYVDFRVKHTAQTAISTVFERLGFRRFISQNSHLVLIVECWPHKNCQNLSASAISQQLEPGRSLNLFTTLIVLCSLCLVIVLTAVVCTYIKRMDPAKTDNDLETKDFAENTQRILVKPKPRPGSPAVPTQAPQTASFYASAADEDEDVETLHTTWVIPLDESPGTGAAVIVVTAEDTKL
ncbi:hypothetical protein BsWGS_13718 [Bradybaena similaris]